MIRKHVAVMLLSVAVLLCGCRTGLESVPKSSETAGPAPAPWPGDATPFGTAKARRQVSTWTERRGYVAIEPHVDIISSVCMSSRITEVFLGHCHKANIEVYLPVSGRPEGEFTTAGKVRASVRRITKQCDELGVDGVDLQYSDFDARWRGQYMDYVGALSRELHRKGRKLSISVDPLTSPDIGEGERYDPEVIGRVCDQVRVMCYNRVGADTGRVGPACTRNGVREAMGAWMKFVPREKLVMGLPATSHDVDLTTHTERQVHHSQPREPLEIIEQGVLSDEAINYTVYRDRDRHVHVLYATDAFSTRAHLATADELDIPAVSFWTADRVTPEMWQAVRDWLNSKPDVAIEVDSDIFIDAVPVVIKTPLDGFEIRYTLDGSDPAADSPLYTRPVVLTDTARVKARVFSEGRPVGFTTASRIIRRVRTPLAGRPRNLIPGCRFHYHEGPWEGAPDYDVLEPVAEGVATAFDLTHSKREEFFGFRFTGYIRVPSRGIYTFFKNSDDGARLWVGDRVVIDDYEWRGYREVRGQIALDAGLYPIKLDYFQWGGDLGLNVAWEGPGTAKQTIPAEVLFHGAADQ